MLFSLSEKLLANIDAICFPSRDDDGLPTDRISEDKIILDCLIGCYDEWNNRSDDYPDKLDDLKTSLMDNLGVDMEHLQSQQQQSQALEKQLQEINQGGNQLQALLEFKASRLSDMEKISEVTKQMEDRVLLYRDRTQRTVEKQTELTTKIQVNLAPTFNVFYKLFPFFSFTLNISALKLKIIIIAAFMIKLLLKKTFCFRN